MRQNIRYHALRTTILAGRRDVHILDGRVMINAAKSFGQQHRRTARRDLQGRAG